jgi:hypothetical protein
MKHINKKIAVCLFVGSAAGLSILAGFFIPPGEGESEFWWSHLKIFFALLGFLGCIGMIIVAKWLGHYWLQRKEDYYD